MFLSMVYLFVLSIPFYSVLFCSVLFCSVLFCSVLFLILLSFYFFFFSLKTLFRGLAANTSLTWLDVSSNFLTGVEVNMILEFDTTCMVEISDTITFNSTLEYLDISDNR